MHIRHLFFPIYLICKYVIILNFYAKEKAWIWYE